MKNFFYNTYIGVTLILVSISIITILIAGTITLLIYGGAQMVINDLWFTDTISYSIRSAMIATTTLICIAIFCTILPIIFLSILSRIEGKTDVVNRADEDSIDERDKERFDALNKMYMDTVAKLKAKEKKDNVYPIPVDKLYRVDSENLADRVNKDIDDNK